MNIQAVFNENTLRMLPKTCALINAAPAFCRDQMISIALREIFNSYKPLDQMSEIEIDLFRDCLEDIFRMKGLIEK